MFSMSHALMQALLLQANAAALRLAANHESGASRVAMHLHVRLARCALRRRRPGHSAGADKKPRHCHSFQ